MKALDIDIYKAFLKAQGLHYVDRNSSHEFWIKKGMTRKISFQFNDKKVPLFHINTNNKTMGLTMTTITEFVKNLKK